MTSSSLIRRFRIDPTSAGGGNEFLAAAKLDSKASLSWETITQCQQATVEEE